MMKNLLLVFVFIMSTQIASQEAIQQWVYNMLERAQMNIDNGNTEQAEKTYKDYADRSYSSNSYDHFVVLRTYAYFLLSQDRNTEALAYLKKADMKKRMPPYDVFMLKFTLGQVFYVEGQRDAAKEAFLEWVRIGTEMSLI